MGQLCVYKGDDTAGAFGHNLSITISAPEGTSLEGCSASFTAQGITKTWDEVESGVALSLAYTHDETAAMKVGSGYGVFRLIDADGNIRTLDDAVPFVVTDDLDLVYAGNSSTTVDGAAVVNWKSVQGRPDFTNMDEDTATVADIVITMKEAEK